MSEIRKDMEKAFIAKFGNHVIFKNEFHGALWAAKWMAGFIAREALDSESGVVGVEQIRQLSKELDHE